MLPYPPLCPAPPASHPAPSSAPCAPIALFDSGVGGLTVLEAIARRLPGESTHYVADQAHVPYGGRPLGEVRSFAAGLTAHAFGVGAKLVVMACNVSSATYAEEADRLYGRGRVLGVVVPGARAAEAATRARRVAVLATEGTVASGAYPAAFSRLDARLEVTQVACPRFVPLVEAGALEGAQAEDAVDEALAAVRRARADVVVLGCTHYPYLLPVLRRQAPDLCYVDPAEATAYEVEQRIAAFASPARSAVHRLFTTGDPGAFEAQAAALLADRLPWVLGGRLDWTRPIAA